MKEVLELMRGHRSVRNFTDETVGDGVVEELLEAARSASSSGHFQAYSVVRVRKQENKDRLAALAGDQAHVSRCPVFLVFCADFRRLRRAAAFAGVEVGAEGVEALLLATVDTALFAQNVLLGAESLGLGGVFVGGIRDNPAEVCGLLSIPRYVYPVFGLCLGRPARLSEVKPRLPLSLVLMEELYSDEEADEGLSAYDSLMVEYYKRRSKGGPADPWSAKVARQLKEKQRLHLRKFLEDRGFGLG